jgi:hypothetical protein
MGYRFNSTIRIKQKPCSRCGKIGPIFSKGRCQQCSTIENTFAKMEQETESEVRQEGLSDLIADLDAVVSKYIRLKYSDSNGQCKCFTCDNTKHWTLQQAGHFIPRGNMFLRFDVDRNLRPQCEHCNCMLHGNIAEYQRQLELQQVGVTDILYEEARIIHKWDRSELKALIVFYSSKVKQMKACLNTNT